MSVRQLLTASCFAGALIAATAAVAMIAVLGLRVQASETIVRYRAPLDAIVVDPFRPPSHIGGAGNRGIEYGNRGGEVVSAAADGRVAFVGAIGDTNYLSIDHADGLRTTYSHLGEMWVATSQAVVSGDAIALAERGLHFGVKIRDHYLDPQVLLDASDSSLVPSNPVLIPPPDEWGPR